MSTKIQSSSTQTATPTPEEQEMEKAQLAQFKQVEPQQTQMFQNAYNLGNQLLTSFQGANSPQWQSLIGGITPQQQQSMISEQQRYLNPQFQANGIYDSGLAYTSSLRAATDLANQNAQFNVGTLQNALNLALSGQAQIQAPFQGASGQLASQLGGLRTITGNTTQTQNPFLQSFYGSMGQGLGQGVAAAPFAMMKCWVAREIFGSWEHPKTIMARFYIANFAPKWFDRFYTKYGERIANFIHDKPILKMILRPLFEWFACMGAIRVGGIYGV